MEPLNEKCEQEVHLFTRWLLAVREFILPYTGMVNERFTNPYDLPEEK